MENLRQDTRYAVRMLLKFPGFTVTVVLALALGIGANSAIFSVIDAVLLKPLPYEQPERLVKLWMRFTGIGIPKDQNWVSAPEFVDLRDLNKSFSHIAAISGGGGNMKIGGSPELVPGASVSAGFFQLLGVPAEIGRTFLPGEDQAGRDSVLVLSHGLWERRFGADRGVVGKAVTMNDISYVIIGVAPAGFQFLQEAEVWTPLSFSPESLSSDRRGNHGLEVVARIKPGITFEQAAADMQSVSQRIIEQNPGYPYRNFQFRVIMNPLLEEAVGDLRGGLWILMGAVGFVLMIACANVANMLLVRATAREREVAIRSALGAGRWRLMQQFLSESLLLAFIGSLAGLWLANWGLAALARLGSLSFPRLAGAHVDERVMGFAMVLALGTGLFFGIVPVLHSSRENAEALKEGGRSASSGAGPQRMRSALVVAEISLSLILLVGAGLLIRSFLRLQQVDPGFRPEGVLTLRISLPENRYAKPESIRTLIRDLMERVRKLPGVESAGGISSLPLSGSGSSGTTTVDSRAVPIENATPEADWRVVTPGYFDAMGMRLIKGRVFDDRDTETSAPVAVIDETMAKTYWPGEDPIGKRLHRGGLRSPRPWSTIVGVVGHVRYRTLEAQSRVQLYWPYAQDPWPFVSLAVRTSMEPRALANAIQREVLAIDPDLPTHTVRTMPELLSRSVARRMFSMLLLAIFAGVALVLAAVGVYGVISYMVVQRFHEMGIRMALGAKHSSVLRLVLTRSLRLILSGIVLGLIGSVLLTRLIASLLFNVQSTDPITFALVSATLTLVALLSSLLPALRATRVDPTVVLRCE